MRIVSSAVMWWGGASNRRAPSSMPVGYASQTGYQKLSISRVAGQREPAPPSKFSKDGGFRNSVFKGIGVSVILAFGQGMARTSEGSPTTSFQTLDADLNA